MDLEVGDIVRFIPENIPNSHFWWEGEGLILNITENDIHIHLFRGARISKNNFVTKNFTNHRITESLEEYRRYRHLQVVA